MRNEQSATQSTQPTARQTLISPLTSTSLVRQ